MTKNNSIVYKLILGLIIVALIVQNFYFPSKATQSDYSLSNATVNLNGEQDGSVKINLITTAGGTFYALDANWTLSEKESTKYLKLSNLEAGGNATPMENDPLTGKVYWADTTFTGYSVADGGSVWTATYIVDKDTPEGTYTVGLTIDAVTGGTAGYDSDESFSLIATITVTRNENIQVSPYTGSFVADDGIDSIDVFYTQDYTNTDEKNVITAYARNKETGKIDTSGEGQINFLVNLKDGYKVDSITVDENYKNLKDMSNNTYRVTKITGDLTINITTKQNKQFIVPTIMGYKSSYEYTGKSIKPDVTVSVENTVLTKDTDYNVTYGTNTDVGTGKIIIIPVSTSKYMFSDVTVPFKITEKQLKKENVTVPSSIFYTGSALKPGVTVKVDNVTLTENRDYSIEYSGQNGKIDDYITIKVIGKGNYSGTITKEVLISENSSNKLSQKLEFNKTSITKNYGDSDFKQEVSHLEGDGKITYKSSNTKVATVDSAGNVSIIGPGTATITATATATNKYDETSTSYILVVNEKQMTNTGNETINGNNAPSSNNNNSTGQTNKDNTMTSSKLPHAGNAKDTIVTICAISLIAILAIIGKWLKEYKGI